MQVKLTVLLGGEPGTSLASAVNGGRLPAGTTGGQQNLIRVLKATMKVPSRGSPHPAN